MSLIACLKKLGKDLHPDDVAQVKQYANDFRTVDGLPADVAASKAVDSVLSDLLEYRTGIAKQITKKGGPDVTRAKKPMPTEAIQDFGEKIGGAAKDVYTNYRDKLAAADKLDLATVPLSKSFPHPEYQKLLDGGADPRALAFVAQTRAEIPKKPRGRYGNISRWVEQVETAREVAKMAISGEIPLWP